MSTRTPNMNLLVSTIGVDSGLLWEQNLNSSLGILDSHNHSPGSGVQIGQDGISITGDFSLGNNNLTLVNSVIFNSLLSSPSSTVTLYVLNGNLYFTDGLSNPTIQITSGGAVNATSSGISNVGGASASFTGSGPYTLSAFTSGTTPANIQGASLLLGNHSSGTNYLTLSPPASVGTITETLPAIPGATGFMTMDTSGNMSAAIPTAGGITGTNITNNINLPGTSVQSGGKNLLVSSTNAATNLAVIRGFVLEDGIPLEGEGFSVSTSTTGVYTVTFTNAFSSQQITVATISAITPAGQITILDAAGTGVTVYTYNASGTLENRSFSFISMGPV